jgi:hypothetical protein
MFTRAGLALIVVGCMSIAAQASEQKTKLGFLMWSAFKCSTYADMAGGKELPEHQHEQARLFQIGYAAGTKFLTELRNRANHKNEGLDDAPWQVATLLEGPNNDFITGRIFQEAQSSAYDSVVTEDNDGVPLAPANYIIDSKTKAAIAWSKYAQTNCQLLKLPQ